MCISPSLSIYIYNVYVCMYVYIYIYIYMIYTVLSYVNLLRTWGIAVALRLSLASFGLPPIKNPTIISQKESISRKKTKCGTTIQTFISVYRNTHVSF